MGLGTGKTALFTGAAAEGVNAVCLGRADTPQEIADLIIWLCSLRAPFITGTSIPVGGGYVAS